jgi:DNA polymerase
MNTALRDEYLAAMGIRQWVRRGQDASAEVDTPVDTGSCAAAGTPASTGLPGADTPVAGLGWPALQERVAGCTHCPLHATRTQTVFGTGNRSADWLVIGEAPGADEDRQGEPFVGRAGQLLTEMLRAAGFERDAVYITNILKCRPPNNRDPQPDEVASCHDYLQRQIDLIGPRLILAVGRIAAHNLLQTDTPVGRLRGRVHHFGPAGIPLVVTYHPAYLLRTPLEKRKAWDDLQLALQITNGQ